MDDSLIQEMPVKRKRKLPQEPDTTVLTRYFAIKKEFPPLHTGGKLCLSSDFKTAFALNECKVSIFDVESGNLVYTLFEENEEVLSFAVSPNDKYIATTNKTFMTRVYLLASLTSTKVNN
jgi:WD40 repeat protein